MGWAMSEFEHFYDQTIDSSLGCFTRKECIQMNIAFAKAMCAARKRGEEHFNIETIVDHTVLLPTHYEREPIYSGMGSAAALCAEETNQHDGVSHTSTRIGGR